VISAASLVPALGASSLKACSTGLHSSAVGASADHSDGPPQIRAQNNGNNDRDKFMDA
jgi:hypothetical protein